MAAIAEQKETKQLILETISAIIAEEGVEAVTFSNIAQRSYLNKGGIAYYFEGKRDMFREYYRYFFAQRASRIMKSYVECNKNRAPVESFCQFVRNELLYCGLPDDMLHKVLRGIFSEALKDELGYDTWREAFVKAVEIYNRIFAQYAQQGVLDMERYERSLTAFQMVSCTIDFKLVYGLDMWDSDWHRHALTEWIIRSFLKDEYAVPGARRRAVVKRVSRKK